jgi:hypothetical protein
MTPATSDQSTAVLMQDLQLELALRDPRVKQWISQFNLPKGTNLKAWLADPRHQYDYKTAIAQGLRPALDEESGQLHWPDMDATGVRPLKSRDHPSYRYTLQDLAPQASSQDQVLRFLTMLGGFQR